MTAARGAQGEGRPKSLLGNRGPAEAGDASGVAAPSKEILVTAPASFSVKILRSFNCVV